LLLFAEVNACWCNECHTFYALPPLKCLLVGEQHPTEQWEKRMASASSGKNDWQVLAVGKMTGKC